MDENRENILTSKGCKNTKARQAVVQILEKAETPLSAEEVFLRIREAGFTANLSTVYRTLELMEDKGLIARTLINDGKARYEIIGEGHRHHLVCTSCHKTVPIHSCPLEALEKDIGKKTRFDITGHRLELYGLCPQCKKE